MISLKFRVLLVKTMATKIQDSALANPSVQAFFLSFLFLLAYWVLGFDGITFSDDVYYLLAGQKFWEGSMETTDYHFSSRWGTYIPSGLVVHLFGLDPHLASVVSLVSYTVSMGLLFMVFPRVSSPWVVALWGCSQVYFLHFLTKVYPDSLLVLWTCLVPVAAVYRKQYPTLAGCVLVLGLFFGFLTKETIVFLAPFPLLLYWMDRKRHEVSSRFYLAVALTGLGVTVVYLGYFWVQFGDPLHRINSINAGHYISEFTYADKGIGSIVRRLTYLPFLSFVERAYWPWLVFTVPGLIVAFRHPQSPGSVFAWAFLCLLGGFWFMSSTLEFYNPIYLNPRHLIILTPIMAFLIGTGWTAWGASPRQKKLLVALLTLGVLIGLAAADWKMAGFNAAFILPVILRNNRLKAGSIALILFIPASYAIPYQQNLKQYGKLTQTLYHLTENPDNQSPVLVNNFIDFSKQILIPGQPHRQHVLIPIENLQFLEQEKPQEIKVLVYTYYLHAYPMEQEDLVQFDNWVQHNGYGLKEEITTGNLQYRLYRKRDSV